MIDVRCFEADTTGHSPAISNFESTVWLLHGGCVQHKCRSAENEIDAGDHSIADALKCLISKETVM